MSGMQTQHDPTARRIAALLTLVVLLLVSYPITLLESPAYLILYQFVYTGMFAAAVIVARDSRATMGWMLVFSLLWLAFGVMNALDPASRWKIAATYAALLPFVAMIIYVLLRYIFNARRVTAGVLLAAITVYLLLVQLFVPVYGLLELAAPGSFHDTLTEAPVFWQQLIYLSMTTLTTTGYGDVLPASAWARVLTNLEAAVGVLYIAVLMARLVGLYSAGEAGKPAA